MAGLPDKVWYVKILPGGKPLKYREKGGGLYAQERYAVSQYDYLKNRGSNVELLIGEVQWGTIRSYTENTSE